MCKQKKVFSPVKIASIVFTSIKVKLRLKIQISSASLSKILTSFWKKLKTRTIKMSLKNYGIWKRNGTPLWKKLTLCFALKKTYRSSLKLEKKLHLTLSSRTQGIPRSRPLCEKFWAMPIVQKFIWFCFDTCLDYHDVSTLLLCRRIQQSWIVPE